MRKLALALLASAATFVALPVAAQYQPWPSGDRNLLVCGDASTCPNQRGTTSPIGGHIVGTAVVTLDFWSSIGTAATSIDVSVVSPGATQLISGVSKVMQVQRTSGNASVLPLFTGQVLDTDISTALQGQMVCFQFQAMSLANYSPANGALAWSVISGTGTAQGFATMTTGWTGASTILSGTVNILPGGLPQSNPTSCARVPGNATEIGVLFTMTPTGTAGTNDAFQLSKVQLETVQVVPGLPVGPTPYASRDLAGEFARALRRAYVITEPATAIPLMGSGNGVSTTACNVIVTFPEIMRAAPTVGFTYGNAPSATTFKVGNIAAATALSTPFLAQGPTANSTAIGSLTATTGATLVAGNTCFLIGANGGGVIVFSADL